MSYSKIKDKHKGCAPSKKGSYKYKEMSESVSSDSSSENSYDLKKDVEGKLRCNYEILTQYGLWQKEEEKTSDTSSESTSDTSSGKTSSTSLVDINEDMKYNNDISKEYEEYNIQSFESLSSKGSNIQLVNINECNNYMRPCNIHFDTSSDDYYLYVEKNGRLEQCKYKPVAICKPIRINKNNVLYCKKYDSLDFLSTESNIDFLDDKLKRVYFYDHDEDSLNLTKEDLKKYKFYKFDTNTNEYKRIYINQNENGNFVSQDIEKVTIDAGDHNNPTKLKNSDISKMKQEVEKLKTQNNTVSSNYQRLYGEYLRLLIQIHNTNYNVQEYKQDDYINICNDREFKKGIFPKSKIGYYFDVEEQNNIFKRYYFFNEEKKRELKQLMQSTNELIAEGKLEVDNNGNIQIYN